MEDIQPIEMGLATSFTALHLLHPEFSRSATCQNVEHRLKQACPVSARNVLFEDDDAMDNQAFDD